MMAAKASRNDLQIQNCEAETSVAVVEALSQLNLTKCNQTNTDSKTLFNFSTTKFNLTEVKSAEYDAYEAQLNREQKEWVNLLQSGKSAIQKNEAIPNKVDINKLSIEDRAYFEEAPDFDGFLSDSLQFREDANIFLKKQVEEFDEIQANIMQTCKRNLSEQQWNAVAKNLANKTETEGNKFKNLRI